MPLLLVTHSSSVTFAQTSVWTGGEPRNMNANNTSCVFLLLLQSLFHANSLQKTHQSALQVQQKAEVTVGSFPSQQPGRPRRSHPNSHSPAPDDAAGGTLRPGGHPELRREGGRALAAADAEDGGPAEAGQRLRGLLQDVGAGVRSTLGAGSSFPNLRSPWRPRSSPSRCAACWRAWSRSIGAMRTGAAATRNWERRPTATTFYL